MIRSLVFIVLSGLVLAATAAPIIRKQTLSLIWSAKTSRFLQIFDNGTVSADGNPGTPETDLYIVYFIDGTLRIRSRSDQGCYLCFENNTFQSCSSSNSNDIFERVQVDRDHVALRVIRQNSSQLGVGAPEEEESTETDKTSNVQMESDEPQEVVSDCYLGFDENTCKPKCYNSAQFKETLFRIYELR